MRQRRGAAGPLDDDEPESIVEHAELLPWWYVENVLGPSLEAVPGSVSWVVGALLGDDDAVDADPVELDAVAKCCGCDR